MKEPEGHRLVEYDSWNGYSEVCDADGEEWPCQKWQRWTASKDYRIKQLEDAVQRLQLDSAGNRRELEGLREAHRRLELLVRAGVLMALHEARLGSIDEKVTRDVQDFTMLGSSKVTRIAGRDEYTVTFTGRNSKYVNGELTEAWSP